MARRLQPCIGLYIVPLLFFAISPVAVADETHDAATLETLLTKVRAVLPAGWKADVTPTVQVRGVRENTPALIIQSTGQLEVEIVAPSSPALPPGAKTPTHRQQVTLTFESRPYVNRSQYTELRRGNELKRQERGAFYKKHLQGIPWAAKTSPPIPPRSFSPRDKAERQLIRQYQFVWLRTAPQKLPTHFYDSLAFDMRRDWYVYLIDEAESAKYEKLLRDVQKIITPYAPARQ